MSERTLALTAELLRAYSRGGNFHSDEEEAAKLGYTKLLAAGMQVAGPAFGALLDEWGDGFLTHGSITLKFVGGAYAGETVVASVEIDNDTASIAVNVRESGTTAVVGTAQRRWQQRRH